MTIHRVLRKLAPLMPDRVRSWRRTLDLADNDVRGLVERQIMLTAHKVLGDFRNRLLLSLPPQRAAAGAINLGTVVYENERWPAGISKAELLQNMAIFGRSGAGKTNLTFHLLTQLHEKRIPFLYLDWKRTARHLLPSLGRNVKLYTPGRALLPFPFNPFMPPPGMEARVYANHVVDAMGDAYTLGDAARSVLHKAVIAAYDSGNTSPNVDELLRNIDNQPNNERAKGWKASAVRALETLATLELAISEKSQAAAVETLVANSTIIELDALAAANKAFLLPLLCLWVYSVKLPAVAREELGLVIFVEEAHHLLYRRQARQESLMEMLLRQCREIGISMVVVDQHPSLISSAALGNTYTSVCLNLKDPRDLAKAAALSLMEDEEKHQLSMLHMGYGIVKLQDRWNEPFLVRIPKVECEKGRVTDEVLQAGIRADGTLSVLSRRAPRESSAEGRSRSLESPLAPAELSFISDVLRFTEDGVNERYKRLGVSADKGNKIKDALLKRGVLEEQAVAIGRTRRVLLRVTARARRDLGLEHSSTRGSLTHEYWKRWYAAQLEHRGYRVRQEAPRNNGWADVLGCKNEETIAVEIETGKSDVLTNVREDLLSGFRAVIVVATDEDAQLKVEQQLASAGLLVPRVVVVLRDKGVQFL